MMADIFLKPWPPTILVMLWPRAEIMISYLARYIVEKGREERETLTGHSSCHSHL